MKSKRNRLLLFFILTGVVAPLAVNAQLYPVRGSYLFNDYYLNPATTGSKIFNPFWLSYQKPNPGLDNSPVHQSVSYHSLISGPPNHRTMGMGGGLEYHGIGPVSYTRLQLSYAYHAEVKRRYNKCAFGLALGATHYAIQKDKLVVADMNDPLIMEMTSTEMRWNASVGMLFYSDRYGSQRYTTDTYHLGWSVMNILGPGEKSGNGSFNSQDQSTQVVLSGAYGRRFKKVWMIEPLMLIRMGAAGFQADITTRVYYHYMDNANVWTGLSLRTGDAFAPVFGLTHQNVSVGYAFEIPVSDIRAYTSPAHAIHIGILMNRRLIKTL